VWAAADVAVADLARLPVQAVAIAADGSGPIERARTRLQQAYPYEYVPTTVAEDQHQSDRLIDQYRQLALVVIVTSLPIAGCSLAVSVVAGLNDRKRPFSLLRLAGAPLGMLRRVLALESAVPLLALALVSIGIGFLTAGLFLSSQLNETLQAPGASYYVIVAAGLLASLAVIASTLPMLRRLTGPEVARNE
jgi:predicted lysophospholipase L1 biosynthesis ABC-type transport system permease subunit